MIGDKLQLLLGENSFEPLEKHVDRLPAASTDKVKSAMKLIGDVLFEADMTLLTRNSKIVAVGERQSDFRSPTGCYEWQQNLPLRFQENQRFRPEIAQQQYTSQNAGQHQRYFPNIGPNKFPGPTADRSTTAQSTGNRTTVNATRPSNLTF
jgi:hypothetical protein